MQARAACSFQALAVNGSWRSASLSTRSVPKPAHPARRPVSAVQVLSATVIGEIKALLDESVDIDGPVLTGALTRMQQHVLYDRMAAAGVSCGELLAQNL
jgi:hypothetical protein